MRNLKNLALSDSPFCALVCFNALDDSPRFALTNYGIGASDADVVRINGLYIPIIGQVDGLSVTQTRPQGVGGIIRNVADCSIKSDGPFTYDIWTRRFYSCGQNDKSFYFGLYVAGAEYQAYDLAQAAHFGMYRLDAGTGYDEASGTTHIQLVDILMSMDERFTDQNDVSILNGSEYIGLANMRSMNGTTGKVQLYGPTEYVSDRYSSAGVVTNIHSGKMAATYTGSGVLNLGSHQFLADNVGNVVTVLLDNPIVLGAPLVPGSSECVSGTVVLISAGIYGLSSVSRDLAWGTASLESFPIGQTVGTPLSLTTDVNTVVLSAGQTLDKVPSDTMWVKYNATLRDPIANTVTTLSNIAVRMISVRTPVTDNRFYLNGYKLPTTYPDATGITVDFATTVQQSGFGGSLAYLNYAKVKAAQVCSLYFRDPTVASPAIVPVGTQWSILVTSYVNNTLTNAQRRKYYIKTFNATITIGSLYYRDNNNLDTPVPPADVVSIETNVTEFGIKNLTRVTLLGNPQKRVFADFSGPLTTLRVDTFVGQLLSTNYSQFLGPSLTSPKNLLASPVISVDIKDQTTQELVDLVLYESGFTLRWVDQKIQIVDPVNSKLATVTWNTGGINYVKAITAPEATLTTADLAENSLSISIGKLLSKLNGVYEYLSVYQEYSFSTVTGGLASNETKLLNNRAPATKERIFSYKFSAIKDYASALLAAYRMESIGHPASLTEVTRTYQVSAASTKAARLEALDIVNLEGVNFASSAADLPPGYIIDTDGLVCYPYNNTTAWALIPGICEVDSISYKFYDNAPVQLVLKQCQVKIPSTLTGIDVALFPDSVLPAISTGTPAAPLGILPTVGGPATTQPIGGCYIGPVPSVPANVDTVPPTCCADAPTKKPSPTPLPGGGGPCAPIVPTLAEFLCGVENCATITLEQVTAAPSTVTLVGTVSASVIISLTSNNYFGCCPVSIDAFGIWCPDAMGEDGAEPIAYIDIKDAFTFNPPYSFKHLKTSITGANAGGGTLGGVTVNVAGCSSNPLYKKSYDRSTATLLTLHVDSTLFTANNLSSQSATVKIKLFYSWICGGTLYHADLSGSFQVNNGALVDITEH